MLRTWEHRLKLVDLCYPDIPGVLSGYVSTGCKYSNIYLLGIMRSPLESQPSVLSTPQLDYGVASAREFQGSASDESAFAPLGPETRNFIEEFDTISWGHRYQVMVISRHPPPPKTNFGLHVNSKCSVKVGWSYNPSGPFGNKENPTKKVHGSKAGVL